MDHSEMQRRVRLERCVVNGFWTFFFDAQEMLISHIWSQEYKMLRAFKAGFEFATEHRRNEVKK